MVYRYTVVLWPMDGAIHSFIPALGYALPEAPSVEAALASAQAFVVRAAAVEHFGPELPADVEVQTQVVEVTLDLQPHMPPELFAAVLNAAIGDVITNAQPDRDAVAALLDTLTSVSVALHDEAADPFDDLDLFSSFVPWSEDRFQETVREVLNSRLRVSQITSNERAKLRRLVQQAIARQLAVARELSLERG